MKPEEFKPYNYVKPDWENNPKWLFDAYRVVALKKDAESRRTYKRFIEWLATEEKLTDPEAIGIVTFDNNLVVGAGPFAEKVVAPFMPLIEAITDEMLELGKVVGHDYLDLMTKEASILIQKGAQKYIQDVGPTPKNLAEKWALREMRQQLRNKVAAGMFRGIREYALAEHLHREHRISEDEYQQALDKIETGLNKAGINGLSRFVKANPQIEEMLTKDDRKFVPYNYKMTEEGQTRPDPTWFTNDQKHKEVKRSEYYQWQIQELEDHQGNPPYADWDYEKARITALYNTIGPDYCQAVKKRDAAMRQYSIGHGGKETQQVPHDYAFNLGHDLSNEELQSLMANGGAKDISAQDAEVIYNVNNMLGALDPRLQKERGDVARKQDDIPADTEHEEKQAQKKSPTSSGSGTKSEENRVKKPEDEEKGATPNPAEDSRRPVEKPKNKDGAKGHSDSGDQQADSKKKSLSNGIKAGSAVLGSILVADQLHRAGKKDRDAEEGGGEGKARKEKSSKALNYVIATAAAVGVGIIVCTKPEKLVKFWDDISGLFGGRAK